MGVLDPALYVPCIAVAAVAKALIFLAWMMAFSDILNPRSGIVLMLAAMTIGWMLCLVVAMADAVVAAVATCLLVLVSGGCLIALTAMSGPRAVPAEPEPAGGISPLSLLPPLFVAGLMLYEFAPGFVTGSIQAASRFRNPHEHVCGHGAPFGRVSGCDHAADAFRGRQTLRHALRRALHSGRIAARGALGPRRADDRVRLHHHGNVGLRRLRLFLLRPTRPTDRRIGAASVRLGPVRHTGGHPGSVRAGPGACRPRFHLDHHGIPGLGVAHHPRRPLRSAWRRKGPNLSRDRCPRRRARRTPAKAPLARRTTRRIRCSTARRSRSGMGTPSARKRSSTWCRADSTPPPSPTGSASRPAPSRRTSSTCTARQASPIAEELLRKLEESSSASEAAPDPFPHLRSRL